jgi:uncharacterized protein HemX
MFDTLKNTARVRLLAAVALVVAASLWNLQTHDPVQAEVREGQKRDAFMSGGARSELVLRDIHETLKQIDRRLERFENAMRAAAQQPQRPVAPPPGP